MLEVVVGHSVVADSLFDTMESSRRQTAREPKWTSHNSPSGLQRNATVRPS